MISHVWEVLTDYRVASVASTTAHSVRKILKDAPLATARVVVEYGPGDGAFTQQLLERMPQDGTLVAIETNRAFIGALKNKCIDKRLVVVNGSALNVSSILAGLQLSKADYIISGIPFSFLDNAVKEQLIRDTYQCLSPQGLFVLYQSLMVPRGKAALKELLRTYFDPIKESTAPLNVPPLFVLEATAKPATSERNVNLQKAA